MNTTVTEAENAWIKLSTNLLGNSLLAKLNYSILNLKLLFLSWWSWTFYFCFAKQCYIVIPFFKWEAEYSWQAGLCTEHFGVHGHGYSRPWGGGGHLTGWDGNKAARSRSVGLTCHVSWQAFTWQTVCWWVSELGSVMGRSWLQSCTGLTVLGAQNPSISVCALRASAHTITHFPRMQV